MRDWRAWQQGYEDPSSSLSRRLTVVRQRVRETIGAPRLAPLRVLSLCSGDGRDLLPIMAASKPSIEFAVLVELDPAVAESARRAAAAYQLDRVWVIAGDAGDPALFADACPVDLLMLCGIFGNISEQDIRATVSATPALLRDGGAVIWTRGATEPDLRPAIRQWFEKAGMRELSFDSEPTGFGIGVAVKPADTIAMNTVPDHIFRFIR